MEAFEEGPKSDYDTATATPLKYGSQQSSLETTNDNNLDPEVSYLGYEKHMPQDREDQKPYLMEKQSSPTLGIEKNNVFLG